MRAHVRDVLAGYKTPKAIVVTDRPLRAPNCKADYNAATDIAVAGIGAR